MKKSILSMALLVATSLVAGDKQPYHIEFSSGLTIFDDSSHLKDGAIHGVSATFYEQSNFSYGVRLGYEHLPSIAYDDIVLESDIDRYYINMIVDGEEELSVTPYLLVGVGYEQLSSLYESYPDTKNQAFINLGIGFRYRLSDYFNVTLESKAVGKLESKSVDYVTKVGLDIMFGGAWSKKPEVLEGLGEVKPEIPPKRVSTPKVKEAPIVKTKAVKKKRWITPEVVEEMFAKPKKEPIVTRNDSQEKMQAELEALKEQMAQNEAAWARKLSSLEAALAKKLAQKRENEKFGHFARLEREAEAGHRQKIAKTKAKIKKVKASLKAIDNNAKMDVKLKKKREAIAREKRRLDLAKRIKEREEAFGRKKAKAAKLKAKKLKAEKRRVALAKAVALEREKQKKMLEKQRRLQAQEKRKLAKSLRNKTEDEKTDILHIANGMAVFAD